MEVQKHALQHAWSYNGLTPPPIAETQLEFAILNERYDGCQCARLVQERDYEREEFVLEECFDMGKYFTACSSGHGKGAPSVTKKTQEILSSTYSAPRTDDGLRKTGCGIEQTPAIENPPPEVEIVEEASSRSSSLTSVSNISALNPENDTLVKYSGFKRKADETDIETAAKQPKRARLLEPFAFLKRNEDVRGVRKKQRVWRWLKSVEPRYLP